MMRLMKTCVLGALLSFAACATSASSAPDPAPAGAPSAQTTADSDDLTTARLAGALLATEPDDAAQANVLNSCVDQCDGDTGCIICCHCTHPNLCCM